MGNNGNLYILRKGSIRKTSPSEIWCVQKKYCQIGLFFFDVKKSYAIDLIHQDYCKAFLLLLYKILIETLGWYRINVTH